MFFNAGWAPYGRRADFLLDADVAVSTHLDHIETRYSFRSRVLDYLWAGLPMVLTAGDVLADEVAEAGLGVTVPAEDDEALEEALAAVLASPPPPELFAPVALAPHVGTGRPTAAGVLPPTSAGARPGGVAPFARSGGRAVRRLRG